MEQVKGLVGDIQRFSIHDGPGIRTTVFLKGCPLNCAWCHNPELIPPKPELLFNRGKCSDCFDCVTVCNYDVHYIKNGRHELFSGRCRLSGDCVNACSYDALDIKGRYYSVEEVLSEVLKDKKYYDNSGGGLTLSGGEPLYQFKFALELLKKAKKKGLHTAVETSGYVNAERLLKTIPHTGLYLYDYKLSDSLLHKKYTGVGNEVILKNLELLYGYNTDILLRCPVIPGVNDNEEHFEGIARILNKYPRINAEIMPYHDTGQGKALKTGSPDRPLFPTPGKAEKQTWLEYFEKNAPGRVTINAA